MQSRSRKHSLCNYTRAAPKAPHYFRRFYELAEGESLAFNWRANSTCLIIRNSTGKGFCLLSKMNDLCKNNFRLYRTNNKLYKWQ